MVDILIKTVCYVFVLCLVVNLASLEGNTKYFQKAVIQDDNLKKILALFCHYSLAFIPLLKLNTQTHCNPS